MAVHEIEIPWKIGYDIGVGVDMTSGAAMNKVVDGVADTVANAQGAMVDMFVQRIESTESLEKALGIDAEMSYGCGCFGGASVRAKFAQSSRIQSSSLFMTVTVSVQLAALSVDKVVLDADASKLVDNPAQFAIRYGNLFVRGLNRGGLFVGVLQINTTSEHDASEMAAELRGSYGLFSADLQAKFKEVRDKYQSQILVGMHHEGGPVNLKIQDLTNPLELLDNANRFLQSFQDTPDAVATPYSVLLSPVSIANGALPPNAADIEHAQDVIVYCAKRRSGIMDQLNLLNFVNDNKSKYDLSNGATWESVKAAIVDFQTDLDLVGDCASAAINHPESAMMPADFAAKRGTNFPKATFPALMPVPTGAAMVETPDFSGCATSDACRTLAKAVGVTLGFEQRNPKGGFRVLEQRPPKGTPVATNSQVTIVCPTSDLKWRFADVRLWDVAAQPRLIRPELVLKPGLVLGQR